MNPRMSKIIPAQIFPRPFFCTSGFLAGSGGIRCGGLATFFGGGGGGVGDSLVWGGFLGGEGGGLFDNLFWTSHN